MRISLLHPSRGRPDKAFDTFANWEFQSSGEHEIEWILSVDSTDPKLQQYQKIFYDRGLDRNMDLISPHSMICNLNTSVVQATNMAAKFAMGDILVYLSDDFSCLENWDIMVANQFENVTEPLLIKVDDCLQKFEVPVLTLPIMNRALYEKLGYFWHPEYKSMFVDEDLYWVCRNMGAMKLCPHLKFPHEHPANGKAENDETYTRSAANWEQGKAVFNKRKLMGFPV